jgi:glycosyltransferase involved in cell wall biosynthesis
MQKTPKVTVLIPTYNCAKYLPQAVESALKQSYQDFEVLVIDDGSTDDTAAIVRGLTARHPEKVRYIHQENAGLAEARNAGIKAAQGELIALLDADDMWLPERLQKGVAAIEADPSIGLVHANITRISESGDILDTPARVEGTFKGNMFLPIFLRQVHISCPTVMFRKACCEKVGYFDSYLTRLGCEDRDLWLRIAQNYKVVYVPEVLAYYRVSSQSMSQNLDKMTKARLYVVDKYFPQSSGHSRIRNKALAKIFRDIGDLSLLKKQYAAACEQYRRAIKHDPLCFWAWINLGKGILKI